MDLEASARVLAAYSPRASAIPAALDMADCPYFWPYCAQPLYAGALPVVVNVTLLNGMGVVGWLEGVEGMGVGEGEGDAAQRDGRRGVTGRCGGCRGCEERCRQ
eukprot:354031-Chlamydomonas_euryale.AAC.5